MSAQVLDGAAIAALIRVEARLDCERLRARGAKPRLAVVLVGNNPASEIYVRSKIKACAEVGIESEKLTPEEGISTAELVEVVESLNAREDVDGILVQLPLPKQVETRQVLERLAPEKDVDGLHPANLGRLLSGRAGLAPCTPAGILQILKRSRIELAGREAVVVGRSELVGKPAALLLLAENATVTLCHSRTRDLAAVCRRADILVAAMGKPALIGREYLRPGVVVVDVGTNRLSARSDVEKYFPGDAARLAEWERRGSTLIGDVDPRASREFAAAYTPVPGGVGPLTVAMLMSNTLTAARARRGLAASV